MKKIVFLLLLALVLTGCSETEKLVVKQHKIKVAVRNWEGEILEIIDCVAAATIFHDEDKRYLVYYGSDWAPFCLFFDPSKYKKRCGHFMSGWSWSCRDRIYSGNSYAVGAVVPSYKAITPETILNTINSMDSNAFGEETRKKEIEEKIDNFKRDLRLYSLWEDGDRVKEGRLNEMQRL